MAVIVATGIPADGAREILALDVGDSEDETFSRRVVDLAKATRSGRLAAGEQRPAHRPGLKRCSRAPDISLPRPIRRNLLAHVPKDNADMVASMLHMLFAQPDAAAVHGTTWNDVRDGLAASFPKIRPLMDEAKAEVFA
jgi:putative transposase